MTPSTYETYDEVSARLDEIVDAVNDENVTLDDALSLYEEAVKLGLLACDLSEADALALLEPEGEGAPANADAPTAEGAGIDDADGTDGVVPEAATPAEGAPSPASSVTPWQED